MTEEDKRLTLKISEHEHGWFYALYEGDGTAPGSLLAAAVEPTHGEALQKGAEKINQQLVIRNCSHSFVSYGSTGAFEQCELCKIVEPIVGTWQDR